MWDKAKQIHKNASLLALGAKEIYQGTPCQEKTFNRNIFLLGE